MSRPVDWAPLAGSDPVPGEPEVVERAGRHYRKVAVAINEAAAKLRRIAGGQDMQSDAVNAFRDSANTVAEEISRAHERYDAVGQALSSYAPQLRDAQDESVAALRQAKDAEAAQASAHQAAEAAQGRVDTAAKGADTTADQGAQRRAAGSADAAGDALAAARTRLQNAIDARDTAAKRAIGGINEVVKDADLNDGLWANYGAKIVEWVGKIADWVAMAAGILALAFAWFPPLAAALATVALIAGAVSLAAKATLALTGDGKWSEVGWAALGVLSFGVGRAAMAGLRGSVKGLKATRALTRVQSKGLGRNLGRLAGKASRRQGMVRNGRDAVADLRKVPGQLKGFKEIPRWRQYATAENFRKADYTGFKGAVDEMRRAQPAFDEARRAGGLARSEAWRHGARSWGQFGAHMGTSARGHYGTYNGVNGIVNSEPSAAEQLNLPQDGELRQPAGAGSNR